MNKNSEKIGEENLNNSISNYQINLTELEEKQRLIKNRLLLIGENLVLTKKEFEEELIKLKKEIKQNTFEISSLKLFIKRILNELENLAKKSEVEILERQIKIFQPLNFARIEDIQKIVKEELLKNNKKIVKEELLKNNKKKEFIKRK